MGERLVGARSVRVKRPATQPEVAPREGVVVASLAGARRIGRRDAEEIYLPGLRFPSVTKGASDAPWFPLVELGQIGTSERAVAVVVKPTVAGVGYVLFESMRVVETDRQQIAQILSERFVEDGDSARLIHYTEPGEP